MTTENTAVIRNRRGNLQRVRFAADRANIDISFVEKRIAKPMKMQVISFPNNIKFVITNSSGDQSSFYMSYKDFTKFLEAGVDFASIVNI